MHGVVGLIVVPVTGRPRRGVTARFDERGQPVFNSAAGLQSAQDYVDLLRVEMKIRESQFAIRMAGFAVALLFALLATCMSTGISSASVATLFISADSTAATEPRMPMCAVICREVSTA